MLADLQQQDQSMAELQGTPTGHFNNSFPCLNASPSAVRICCFHGRSCRPASRGCHTLCELGQASCMGWLSQLCRQSGEVGEVSRLNSLGVVRDLPGTYHKVQCWEALLRTQPRTLPHPAGTWVVQSRHTSTSFLCPEGKWFPTEPRCCLEGKGCEEEQHNLLNPLMHLGGKYWVTSEYWEKHVMPETFYSRTKWPN